MFIKLYTKEQLNCFPIYVHTAETGHIQEQCTRPEGYNAHHLFEIEQGEGVVKLDNTRHTLVKEICCISEHMFPTNTTAHPMILPQATLHLAAMHLKI